MRIIAHSLFALASLSIVGCVAGADDVVAATGAPAAQPEDWSIGASTSLVWDSGKTNNLSAWLYAKCNVEYGGDYLLTGINAYKENTGNLDNFIGKLGAECAQFDLTDDDLPQTGTSSSKNIFTSTHYRAGVFGIDVPGSDAYPIGLQLNVNSVDGYVKDMRIVYASKTSSGLAITTSTPSYTAWATGYSGDAVTKTCADQEVLSGVQIKYDTDKGKIRKLEIFCRTLTFI